MVRTGAIDEVQRKARVAYECGFTTWQPNLDLGTVKQSIMFTAGVHLSGVERDTYGAMTPAMWWVSFERGWAEAGRLSSIGGRFVDG